MPLTLDQETAISVSDTNVILIASAGSGKTSVLVEKYAALLGQVEPQNILAITFTEKAAKELKNRIQKKLGLAPGTLDQTVINTFHGFCADLLKEKEEIKIMDEHLTTAVQAQLIHDGLLTLLEEEEPSTIRMIAEFGFHRTHNLLLTAFDESYNLRHWWSQKKEDLREDPLIVPFFELFEKIHHRYQLEKKGKGLSDFDDLEEKIIHLLETNVPEREKLQNRFRFILVDEFQDTSPIQTRLLDLLHQSGKNLLFAVGDPKQSIYQFRGADLSLFKEKIRQIKNGEGKILYLRDNFRSSPALIEPINRFFEKVLPPEDFQPMLPRSEKEGLGIQTLPLIEVQSASERRLQEAGAIASKIIELRQEKRDFREMVCLFRTRTAIPLFEKVFQEHQIPCHAVSRGALFEAQEVLDLVNLLKVIANPNDTLSLVGVLRSPLFGLTDEEIFLGWHTLGWHTLEQRAGTLLKKYHFAKELNQWSKNKTISALLLHLCELSFLEKLFRTAQETANLERLIALAESFEALGVTTLAQFLTTVEALREAGTRIPEASLFAPSANCVRLMTVHASKGLEFPIVFMTDLSYRPRTDSPLFQFHPQKGIGFKHLSEDSQGLKDHFEKSPEYERLEEEKKKKGKEESMRLLYVAMTRAQEGLFLPLTPINGNKKGITWNDLLVPLFLDKG
ncbi:MAG: UvrD-helicase domain-containing protein [Deltaproteobacteria bacterium]|nr:UvrD-helicase domain-containing protein [Deltaproteobacteria bacterium]